MHAKRDFQMTAEEIRAWLERWIDTPADWRITTAGIQLPLGSTGQLLTLSESNIVDLTSGVFPRHRSIKLVRHCGIECHGYAEYLIQFDSWYSWHNVDPIRFNIANSSIVVGHISPLLAIILEELYRSSEYGQNEFWESYATLTVEHS